MFTWIIPKPGFICLYMASHLIGNIHVRRFTDFSCIHNICCINPPFYLILFSMFDKTVQIT